MYKTVSLKRVAERLVWSDWEEIKREAAREAGFLPITDVEREILERGFAGRMHMSVENVNRHALLTLDGKVLSACVSLNPSGGKFKFTVTAPDGRPLDRRETARVAATMSCADCSAEIHLTLAAKFFTRDTPFCRACQKRVLHRCDSYRKTYESSVQTRHGCRRPLQSPEIRERMQQTMVAKYGAAFSSQSSQIESKRKATMLAKYGRENFWTGTNIWLHTGHRPAKIGRVSKVEREVVDLLIKALPGDTAYSYQNGQKRFLCGDGAAFLDYYNETRCVAVEIYGDYFHGNPLLFTADHVTYYGRRVQDIWDRDAQRIEAAKKELGVQLIVVWESDWRQDSDAQINMILKEITK